jgi:hypothetical protein
LRRQVDSHALTLKHDFRIAYSFTTQSSRRII